MGCGGLQSSQETHTKDALGALGHIDTIPKQKGFLLVMERETLAWLVSTLLRYELIAIHETTAKTLVLTHLPIPKEESPSLAFSLVLLQ